MSRAYNAAHVAVLVIDAHHALLEGQGVTKRELGLAAKVISEGRPLIVAINKLDTLAEAARSKVCAFMLHAGAVVGLFMRCKVAKFD